MLGASQRGKVKTHKAPFEVSNGRSISAIVGKSYFGEVFLATNSETLIETNRGRMPLPHETLKRNVLRTHSFKLFGFSLEPLKPRPLEPCLFPNIAG